MEFINSFCFHFSSAFQLLIMNIKTLHLTIYHNNNKKFRTVITDPCDTFETLLTSIEEFMDSKDDIIGCYLKLGNRWSEVSLNDSTFVAFTPEIKHVKYILTT
ncbi:2290_t:CDS:1, partial [Entrophospora sp. SA101]